MEETVIQSVETFETNKIFIKRDDLIPISFGGNKARKAAYFFKEIDALGYDCVVTYGSSSSNHCRVISNMAAMRNLPCCIIGPLEASKPTFNRQMMELFGAKCITVPVDDVHETIAQTIQALKDGGKKPYFIAGGGHGNLGTQAYVDCYEEIRRFEQAHQIQFDFIFLASGTGTTQAGLVAGQLIHGDDRNIVGISIARANLRGRQVVLDSIWDYLRETKCSVEKNCVEQATIFVDRYTCGGYGKQDAEVGRAINTMLCLHGIALDATYTGKAYAGMQRYIRDFGIVNKHILFLHTGGTPLFFDYLREGTR